MDFCFVRLGGMSGHTFGVKNIRGIYTDGSTTDWLGDDFEETPTTKLYSKILMYGIQ